MRGSYRTSLHTYKLNLQFSTKVVLLDNDFVPANIYALVPISEITINGFDTEHGNLGGGKQLMVEVLTLVLIRICCISFHVLVVRMSPNMMKVVTCQEIHMN